MSIIGMLIAFIPCLGFLNWVVIPFAMISLVINIIAYVNTPYNFPKSTIVAGLILSTISILFGLLRLIIGGGIF